MGKDPDEIVDEILGYIDIIKKKLVGDDFSTLAAKVYNIETFTPEKCPECGNLRQIFFMLMQPGENLFDNVGPEKTITNYKIFCLECTKKIKVLDRIERAYHFSSTDGEQWRQEGTTPVLQNTGWHDFYTRPACLLPLDVGFLLVYEGSTIQWHDPGYNIATGLAYTADMKVFVDLTPHEPLLTSTTPGKYHTWRYSHWLVNGDKLHVYFEAARPNGSNEIRVSVFPL